MSPKAEQLFDRIVAELGDVRKDIDKLGSQFPDDPTIKRATEIHDVLNKRLAEAKEKATRDELREDYVLALSESISLGIKQMFSLVASD